MVNCQQCGRYFKTRDTLRTHETGFHRVKAAEADSDNESMADENGAEHDTSDVDNDSQSNNSNANSEAEMEENDMNDDEKEPWQMLVKSALDDMDFDKENIDELFDEPNFSRFLDNIRHHFTDYVAKCSSLKSSELYKKIKATTKQLQQDNEQDYDDWEAEANAWNLRKNYIWQFFNENRDLFDSGDTDSVTSGSEASETNEDVPTVRKLF